MQLVYVEKRQSHCQSRGHLFPSMYEAIMNFICDLSTDSLSSSVKLAVYTQRDNLITIKEYFGITEITQLEKILFDPFELS